jgi:TonB family protein
MMPPIINPKAILHMKADPLAIPTISRSNPFISVIIATVLSILIYLALPLTQMIDSFNIQCFPDGGFRVTCEAPLAPPDDPPVNLVEPVLVLPDDKPDLKPQEFVFHPPAFTYEGPGIMTSDIQGLLTNLTSVESLIINPKDLDEPPQPQSAVAPVYPASLKHRGISGRVIVEFVVSPNGEIVSPFVVSSTDDAFKSPAIAAIRQWRFKPGLLNGERVSFRMRVPFEFNVK